MINNLISSSDLHKNLTEIYQQKIKELKNINVTISTGSMRPLIKPGELITCEYKENYKPGDVIIFFNGSKIIAHRIVQIRKNEIFTQGDNNISPDPLPTTKDHIIGVIKNRKNIFINAKSYTLRMRNKILFSLKNFIDKRSTNQAIQLTLAFIYKFLLFFVRTYGALNFNLKVYLGGSFARNQQVYGSSDLDFYFISKKKSFLRHFYFMKRLHSFFPVINLNSIISADLYNSLSSKGYFKYLKAQAENQYSSSFTHEVYECLRLIHYIKLNQLEWKLKRKDINHHNITQLCRKLLKLSFIEDKVEWPSLSKESESKELYSFIKTILSTLDKKIQSLNFDLKSTQTHLDFPILNIKTQRVLNLNYSEKELEDDFLNYSFTFSLTPLSCRYLNEVDNKQVLEEKFYYLISEYCNLNFLEQSGMHYYRKLYSEIKRVYSKLTNQYPKLERINTAREEKEYFLILDQIEDLSKDYKDFSNS